MWLTQAHRQHKPQAHEVRRRPSPAYRGVPACSTYYWLTNRCCRLGVSSPEESSSELEASGAKSLLTIATFVSTVGLRCNVRALFVRNRPSSEVVRLRRSLNLFAGGGVLRPGNRELWLCFNARVMEPWPPSSTWCDWKDSVG